MVARSGTMLVATLAAAASMISSGCSDDGGDSARPMVPAGAAGPMVPAGAAGPMVPAGAAGVGAMAEVSYAGEVQPLFELACNCHTGPNFMQLGAPFSLEATVAHGNLVSQPSQQVPSMLLVAPGSLNESYLWLKVNGTQAEVGGGGQIMPPNVPLTDTEKDLVARWIVGGAQP